jgi:uncharacterized protein (UPF0335 family)
MSETEQVDAARIGHNSNMTAAQGEKFRGFVAEIERLEEEMRSLASDRGNIYKRAKSEGFDTKALREAIRLRRMNDEARNAFMNAVDAYLDALGMLADTPLGQAAMERDGVAPAH